MNEKHLEEIFSEYGKIKYVRIPIDERIKMKKSNFFNLNF